MKQNTIILNVDDYNEMRDFNKNIKKNNLVRVSWGWADAIVSEIYTKDEAVIKLTETNIKLAEEINKLKYPVQQELSINKIKQMSWWEFRKWKRNS